MCRLMASSHSDRLCNPKTHWFTLLSVCVCGEGRLVACLCASDDANSGKWTPCHKQPQHSLPSFTAHCLTASHTHFILHLRPLIWHSPPKLSLTSWLTWLADIFTSMIWGGWMTSAGALDCVRTNESMPFSPLHWQISWCFIHLPHDQQALQRLTRPNNKEQPEIIQSHTPQHSLTYPSLIFLTYFRDLWPMNFYYPILDDVGLVFSFSLWFSLCL